MTISGEVNRFNPRQTQVDGSRGFGIQYPSPFFDVAQQFLPTNQHELHKWCRYYFLTNPIINAACSKLAEYPVTPLVFETEDPELQKLGRKVEGHLKLRSLETFCERVANFCSPLSRKYWSPSVIGRPPIRCRSLSMRSTGS